MQLTEKEGKIKKMSVEDFSEISSLICRENSVFQAIWRSCEFFWDSTIATAQVEYHLKTGAIALRINPDSWASCTKEGQRFILLHEGFHLFLDHFGIDSKVDLTKYNPKNMNIAQDIPINHLIEKAYVPSCREEFEFKLCFVDTVFDKATARKISDNEKWTYYYQLLDANSDKQPQAEQFDGNSKESAFGEGQGGSFQDLKPEIQQEAIEAAKEAIEKESNKEDILKIVSQTSQHAPAGKSALGALIEIAQGKVQKSRKWESLVQDMLASMIKVKFKDKLSWAKMNRTAFGLNDDSLILPGETEQKLKQQNEKFRVVAFLDTSGSCYSQATRFFNLIKTMPEDLFELEVFSFDYYLYPVDMKSQRLRGGGGTSFSILKEEIDQREVSPDVIFVLTDGEAEAIYPKHPKKWIWLLTHDYDRAIPKESKKILLSNFE